MGDSELALGLILQFALVWIFIVVTKNKLMKVYTKDQLAVAVADKVEKEKDKALSYNDLMNSFNNDSKGGSNE